jgi:dipeptidyl aminopeptidase/acylaminoacyl peptidase
MSRFAVIVTTAVVAILLLLVAWGSQAMVHPPRPRVSQAVRPVLGLLLQNAPRGGVEIVRAATPARRAGLSAGDRIVKIDGKVVRTASSVDSILRGLGDGDLVRVVATRQDDVGKESIVWVDAPVQVRPDSPLDQGLDFEDVEFVNSSGQVLRGWFVPPPASKAPAVVFGHGNAADRRHWLAVVPALREAGFASLLFDFSGRGESDGDTVTLGAREAGDIVAAVGFLRGRAEVDPRRIAVCGRSMGAAAAILAAAAQPDLAGALVLDSSFADLPRLVDEAIAGLFLPPLIVRPLLFEVVRFRAGYDPAALSPREAIGHVAVPMLVLHGTADRVVPFSHALELVAASHAHARLLPLPGLDHNAPRPSFTADAIVRFLEQALPESR